MARISENAYIKLGTCAHHSPQQHALPFSMSIYWLKTDCLVENTGCKDVSQGSQPFENPILWLTFQIEKRGRKHIMLGDC